MKNLFPMIAIALLSMLLQGCNSTSKQSKHDNYAIKVENIYLDDAFSRYRQVGVESVEEIFAVDETMKQVVADNARQNGTPKQKARNLINYIFSESALNLEYSSHANLTAIETFHSREANCMSLTIMAYALAKEAKLNIVFQEVEVPEYWTRNGKYNLLTGHVNLRILKDKYIQESVVWNYSSAEIDFDPFVRKRSFPKQQISKNLVVAMFYNNKGSDALVNQEFTKAYAYFKAATKIAPDYSAGWSNLGILYRQTNHVKEAITAYRHAIAINPTRLNSYSNLEIALRKNNLIEEADEIAKTLEQKRSGNPYYHALLGDNALYQGNLNQAKIHFKKAIRLDSKVHEFYYGLAKTYAMAGQFELASNAMSKAIKLNKTTSVERTYVAKLNILNQQNGDYDY